MLNNKGFTLIELLVALALLVILTGALYGTYFSVMAAREKGGVRIEERRELSTTLSRLHSELASAFIGETLAGSDREIAYREAAPGEGPAAAGVDHQAGPEPLKKHGSGAGGVNLADTGNSKEELAGSDNGAIGLQMAGISDRYGGGPLYELRELHPGRCCDDDRVHGLTPENCPSFK